MKRQIILLTLLLLSFLPNFSSMFVTHTISQPQKAITVEPLGITANGNFLYVTTSNGILTLTLNLTIVNFTQINDPVIPLVVGNTIYVTNSENNIVSLIQNGKVISNITIGSNFEAINSGPSLPRMYYGYGMAYDPNDNLLYIADSNLGYVVTINTINGKINYIYGFYEPTDVIYDPNNGNLYVLDFYNFEISIVKGTNVVGQINVKLPPAMGIIVNNTLYYTSFDYSYVVAYNLTSGSQTCIPVGNNPYFLTYDPQNGNVYVSEFGSGGIAVIHGTKLIENYSIGSQPAGILYYDGLLYVVLYGNNEIEALNPNNMTVVYSLPLTITYTDVISYNGNLYITEYYNDKIIEVNSSGKIINQLLLNSNPYSITEVNNILYVTCPNSNRILEVSPSLSIIGYIKVPDPTWITSYQGNLYVTSFSKNLLYVICPNGFNLTIRTGNGPSFVTVYEGKVIIADELSKQLTIYYDGQTKDINLTFSPLGIIGYKGYIYVIGNNEIEIFNNNFNVVNKIFITEQIIPFSFPLFYDGVIYNNSVYITYGKTIGVFNGSQEINAYNFNNIVTGIAVLKNNIYAISPLSSLYILSPPPSYLLTIKESGLPNGTKWGIQINGTSIYSSDSVITLNLTEGIYNLKVLNVTYYYSNFSFKEINVSNNLTIYITFYPIKYNITFHEVGLPNGTKWGIQINGTNITTNLSTISLKLPYGKYSYKVLLPKGYNTSTLAGSFTANNTLVISIIFYQITTKSNITTTTSTTTSSTTSTETTTSTTTSKTTTTQTSTSQKSISIQTKIPTITSTHNSSFIKYIGIGIIIVLAIIIALLVIRKS
ncbi:hypothetical protein SJAV_00960 [Sulfurisphaera javensis]|uniref:Uncharacterized protein n=1 Tax=Sulfurisphaera javensis TaxID=2049879 RepID=A0AAT9GMQ3_9CREN